MSYLSFKETTSAYDVYPLLDQEFDANFHSLDLPQLSLVIDCHADGDESRQ